MFKNVLKGYFVLKRSVIVRKRLENGMERLVKMHKGERYNYKMYSNGNVILAKEVANEDTLRDVIKMPVSDFKKYFKEVHIWNKQKT